MDSGHCRLSSKHSKTHEAESVQMQGEMSDHCIKDKQAKKISETTDHHSSSKDSSCGSRSTSTGDIEGKKDVIRRYKCINNNHSDTHMNGAKCKSSSARKSSSSSSSESSSDDFLGMEIALKYSKSGESILASECEAEYVSITESSVKSEVDNSLLLPTSTYEVYNLIHSQNGMSPTASPSIQEMDRSGSPDASGISSWVFGGDTANQSECSIASNDSLFSLQLGQPSFSREKALAFGQLGLPGEFTKSSESNNPVPSIIQDEIDTAIKTVVENLQTETSLGSFKLEGEGLVEAYKSVMSSLSDSSETGICPVDLLALKKKKKRSRRWCCYKSSKVFCSLWSSSDWSDSCEAFSSCWNSSRKKYLPHTSPILAEAERSDNVQMDIPQLDVEKLASEVTSNFTAISDSCCNWFDYCPSCTWMLSDTCCECCC